MWIVLDVKHHPAPPLFTVQHAVVSLNDDDDENDDDDDNETDDDDDENDDDDDENDDDGDETDDYANKNDNENNDAAHLPTVRPVAVSLKLPHKGFIIAVLLFCYS